MWNTETQLIQKIRTAKKIWLSTHKNSDGDGLGSEVAFYHALKSISKDVRVVHNDRAPQRYSFLTAKINLHDGHENLAYHPEDIALIFDTHDPLLCEPFFEKLRQKNVPIFFIDHHVPVKKVIENVAYLIDENACCTGEIVFDLIQKMGIEVNSDIATALYASLLFDTQNFKYLRNSAKPFDMASQLLKLGANHLLIQKNIFDNWSVDKMNYLSLLIKNVDYRDHHKIALIKIEKKNLIAFNLSSDDVSDFVDLFMSIQSLEVAIVIREEEENTFKLSFRSRTHEVLSWAQRFNGGGHLYSSGAWIKDSQENIIQCIESLIKDQKLQKLTS